MAPPEFFVRQKLASPRLNLLSEFCRSCASIMFRMFACLDALGAGQDSPANGIELMAGECRWDVLCEGVCQVRRTCVPVIHALVGPSRRVRQLQWRAATIMTITRTTPTSIQKIGPGSFTSTTWA